MQPSTTANATTSDAARRADRQTPTNRRARLIAGRTLRRPSAAPQRPFHRVSTDSRPSRDRGAPPPGGAAGPDRGAKNARPASPAGPYGTTAGKVLADRPLEGYVRFDKTGLATSAAYGATSLADLRTKTQVKYLVIHMSAYWC